MIRITFKDKDKTVYLAKVLGYVNDTMVVIGDGHHSIRTDVSNIESIELVNATKYLSTDKLLDGTCFGDYEFGC